MRKPSMNGWMSTYYSPFSRGNFSVPLDGQRGREGQAEVAHGTLGLPGGLVAAVGERLLQDVVDPVTEHLVVLLHADAVGLLGEGLVEHRVGVLLLGHIAGEDAVVGGDGLNLVLLQGVEALGVH